MLVYRLTLKYLLTTAYPRILKDLKKIASHLERHNLKYMKKIEIPTFQQIQTYIKYGIGIDIRSFLELYVQISFK
jgi:hypothetical protein